MTTKIVDSWAKVPFIGIQSAKWNNPQEAFKYAISEYAPYGYNVAYFSTDVNTLFITKS